MHYGTAAIIRNKRAGVLDAANAAHPERFVQKPPEPPKLPSGSWINKPDDTEKATQQIPLNGATFRLTDSDQATVESKNNHLVRKYAFYYRYDTPEERAVLNRLWPLVNDRLNYLTPTIKPTGYASTADGRRRRLYDTPQTPLDRLLATETLSRPQQAELIAYRDSLNPAKIAREITDLQNRLLVLAKEKTEQLYLASIPTALPDIHKGIRTKAC